MPSRARPINPRAFTGDTGNTERAEDRGACRGSTKKRQRPSSTRRGPDEAGSGCAMVARSARWLRHYPWKHPRRNRQRRSLRYANRINAASIGDTPRVSGVPIRRPRRPEHSWSRYRRTAQQLQSAAVHSRLTDRTPSSIDRRRCSCSQYSRRFVASVLDKTLRGGGGQWRTTSTCLSWSLATIQSRGINHLGHDTTSECTQGHESEPEAAADEREDEAPDGHVR